MTSTPPEPPAEGSDWLLPPAAEEIRSALPPGEGQPRPRRRLGALASVGLVAAGALAGAVAVTALTHRGAAPTTTFQPSAASGALGGQGGGQPGRLPGAPDGDGGRRFGGGFGGGGVAGEQRLRGTLTAVGGSTVTVRTAGGTATYTVTPTTEIVRDGRTASLGDLVVGDPVLVHVYPSGSGGQLLVERILAGTLPSFGGRPGPGGADQPGGQAGATST